MILIVHLKYLNTCSHTHDDEGNMNSFFLNLAKPHFLNFKFGTIWLKIELPHGIIFMIKLIYLFKILKVMPYFTLASQITVVIHDNNIFYFTEKNTLFMPKST